MKITEASLDRTFNLGNLESLKIELKATFDEDTEGVQKVLKELDTFCHEHLKSAK